ncbi:uncharacterized protein LOC133743804 isoform X1 [Rosa rugosa]|uniref:uncharacterized protein LOC133743804 isoform X1 n=1 Tax=Rosa rugosa TaxID=74645 RepID=UPI002B415D22|nr:uncharacterized protein LOC133743804 isoform X1 [Rosa rugosa]
MPRLEVAWHLINSNCKLLIIGVALVVILLIILITKHPKNYLYPTRITSGAAALVFSAFYIMYLFLPLQWIGMNAMLVYVMAAEGIFARFINGWYYKDPHNTLIYWIQKHIFVGIWHSRRVGILLYVIFAEILFWGIVAGILHWGLYRAYSADASKRCAGPFIYQVRSQLTPTKSGPNFVMHCSTSLTTSDKNDKDLDRASERQDLEGKELKQETTLHELELVAVHALHELVSLVHSHVNAAGQYDFE